jgi:RNA polymerase sigma factor (sigma-70 family)
MARRLLAGLPARQRAAVALRFYDDLAFAEIATILDCPESTARSYVHRALERLRAQLEADGDD